MTISPWSRAENLLTPYNIATTQGWHTAAGGGRWDVEAMARDLHSFCSYSTRGARGDKLEWEEAAFVINRTLLIGFSDKEFGYRSVQVWADSPERAEQELSRLKSLYLLPEEPHPEVDEFFLVTCGDGEIRTRSVELEPLLRDERDVCLHYGEGFCRWHAEFLRKLKAHSQGLTILQGPSGTGKTSYLRYLLHALRRTHRFYYLPVTIYPMLASPQTANFWVLETRSHQRKQKVVFIEDAEMLLMERAADNQASLSNLLNIADGFLGAFLQMHIICTVNARIDKLDPAVLRPGRLLTRYVFSRLSQAQAKKLAAAKGLQIREQENYSLAEIYNDYADDTALPVAPLGFCNVSERML